MSNPKFPEIPDQDKEVFKNQSDYIGHLASQIDRRADITAVVMLMVQMANRFQMVEERLVALQVAYNDMAKKLNDNRVRIITP